VRRNKLDLTKIHASLDAICTGCGYSIPPNEQVRIDSERMRCPKCGNEFKQQKKSE
jgi:predicted RNA-binding Zn-ribbon protein involved in translation (DUF1610 family)